MKQKNKSKFNSIFGILKRIFLFFLLCSTSVLTAQTAANISSASLPLLALGVPINSSASANTADVMPNTSSGGSNFLTSSGGSNAFITGL